VAYFELRQCSETHTHELETELPRQGIQGYQNLKVAMQPKLKEAFREALRKDEKAQKAEKSDHYRSKV